MATASHQQRNQPVVRNRLPALAEVLRRSTRPPVDLYCYYLFLQREGGEDTLDFWLDVQQHENLCRAYFKDLRKSGIPIHQDWPQYAHLARTRGSIYGNVTGLRRGEPSASEEYEREGDGGSGWKEKGLHPEQQGSEQEQRRYNMRTPSPTLDRARSPSGRTYPLTPTLKSIFPHDRDPDSPPPAQGRRSSTPLTRPVQEKTSTQPFIPRSSAISRLDLLSSAERIYSRYLMPGAEKEIYLPPSLRMTSFPLSSPDSHSHHPEEAQAEAEVPDMFHRQKEWVYRQMEGDSFPRFLRGKAFGNLTPVGSYVRLGLGLALLWVGLATAFAFVFLDVRRVKRLWIILPLALAILNLLANQYDLDPLLVFMGLSETHPFRHLPIREPYVRKLLFGRALWVTFLTAVLTAVVTVIFVFVPGHRL